MARRGGMEGLSTLLPKIYPGKTPEDLAAVHAFGAFMKALSPRIVENARPVRLHRGTLTVHTTTSAWASTLQLESEALLAAMRRKVKELKVRKLVFRVGPMPAAAAPMPELPEPPAVLPAEELPEDIARALARIGDDTLRAAVAKAAATGLGEPPRRKKR